MSLWQVVEREDFGTDWHVVRYDVASMSRFASQEEATKAATKYLTSVNCDNSLTPHDKRNSLEAFMKTPNGIFLGVLDGKDWYLTYPKDIAGRNDQGERTTLHNKGEVIKDDKYFELEGKTQVDVRIIPGT
jgi:hypothetical protein